MGDRAVPHANGPSPPFGLSEFRYDLPTPDSAIAEESRLARSRALSFIRRDLMLSPQVA